MPAKHHSPEQSESLKQDPTERRRLQNRLSQRNHRTSLPFPLLFQTQELIDLPGRKIRDRIAKLQERVIASELRAAATLHGWHSAPCIPYEVKPSPSSTSSSLSLSPSSPPAELQPASYNVDLNTMPQLPLFSTSGEFDETGTAVSSLSGSGTSSPTAPVSPDVVAGSVLGLAQGYGLDTVQMCEQWGFQGSVYLATGISPYILHCV